MLLDFSASSSFNPDRDMCKTTLFMLYRENFAMVGIDQSALLCAACDKRAALAQQGTVPDHVFDGNMPKLACQHIATVP
jgi:hypothetical protein